MLFSAWQATTQASQPVHVSRSTTIPQRCGIGLSFLHWPPGPPPPRKPPPPGARRPPPRPGARPRAVGGGPAVGMLFSAWQATTQASQPVHVSRSTTIPQRGGIGLFFPHGGRGPPPAAN